MTHIILVVHNIRSTFNVGSLLRTSEGLGIEKVYLTGYTPYPKTAQDSRLPHIADKMERQIVKTSLGAEKSVSWKHATDIKPVLETLKHEGWIIAALEQTSKSRQLPTYTTNQKLVLVIGREVEGIEPEVLSLCDIALEIPMAGEKESFNVASAAAMALYQLQFALTLNQG